MSGQDSVDRQPVGAVLFGTVRVDDVPIACVSHHVESGNLATLLAENAASNLQSFDNAPVEQQ